ncbi:MAG: hypothetical protein QGI86_09695 [Candidatus Poribacteria bacterium]|jgi:hypothetical protein|nr:hypothetical protein [Candidatus Poribacteria bacterium]MDP6750110.1 hypothetical protein [Candidatus Poribacteria bacterium]MDP6996636.1 hypothetical protein [Candidatus Poribacteria bacterium]
MDANEVTVGQFKHFVDESGGSYGRNWNSVANPPPSDDYPVIYINWYRQSPLWFLLMLMVVWLLTLALMMIKPLASLPFFLLAILLTTLFGGLTVEVDEKEIRPPFGIGLIRRTISHQRIIQVA